MNRKELSAVVAECAEVTQRAVARTEEARAGVEMARKKQEEAVARQEAATGKQEEAIARQEAATGKWDEMIAEERRRTEQIIAELKDQRDERRALMEALLQLMDRLPPPPPHLRSA